MPVPLSGDFVVLVGQILSQIPTAEWDLLFPLLRAAGPVEKLTGDRPHRSALHRWEKHGLRGTRLGVIRVGKTRYTTPRLLVEFFVRAGTAQDLPRQPGSHQRHAGRRPAARAPEDVS